MCPRPIPSSPIRGSFAIRSIPTRTSFRQSRIWLGTDSRTAKKRLRRLATSRCRPGSWQRQLEPFRTSRTSSRSQAMATSATSPVTLSDSGAVFGARPGEIAQAPSSRQVATDRAFRATCFTFALLTILLVAYIVLEIAWSATPAIRRYGFEFISGRVWDPNTERYGILAEMWGTVYTSVLALVLGVGFGVAAAIFLSEGYMGQGVFSVLRRLNLHLHPIWGRLPDQLERLLKNLIELLAA